MSSFRIPSLAAPGALLKAPTAMRKQKYDMGRNPRQRDVLHLEAIRQCPCVACGLDPCGEAAHIRMTRTGKPTSGIGNKPSDFFTAPLCASCHREQHNVGELSFWADLEIDPLRLAETLYRLSPNVEAMRAGVFTANIVAQRE